MEEGQTLMVLEAMKMEYQIKAPHGGVLKKLHFKEGDPVNMGAPLADIEEG